jgi:hypothetical protein
MKTNQSTNIKKILFTFVFSGALFAVNNPMTWQNEVYDCDAMKYNGEYYFSGNFLAGDMLVSRDLRNWGWRTHVFSYNNSWHSGTDRDIHGSHMRYENGVFHVDTADVVGGLISDFLAKRDFDGFVEDFANYRVLREEKH